MNIAGQKSNVPPYFPPEALESRIAPTVFLLSAGFAVKSASGVVVTGDTNAAELTGADLVVPLVAGDTLVLDANGNLQADASETTLIKVTSGRALAFFEDIDGDASYADGELTGLAFGGVFGGRVAGPIGGIHGSIAALLDATGSFSTAAITDGSIKGLVVDGYVWGDVLAGGPITEMTLGAAGDIAQAAAAIATGTATWDRELSFDDGGTTFTPAAFEPPPGAVAPSITKLTLLGPAQKIRAGEGGDITDLTIFDLSGDLVIAAGDGRFSETTYAGGAGGKVANVKITATSDASVEIHGGSGAYGEADYFEAVTETVTKKVRALEQDPETPGVEYEFIDVEVVKQKAYALAGAGGAGGSISGITLTSLGGVFDANFTPGDGGNGSMIFVDAEIETVTKKVRSPEQDPETPGVEYDYIDVDVVKRRAYMKDAGGGAGGSVSGVTLAALGGDFGFVDISSRPGGAGAGNKVGGVNGSIDHIVSYGSGVIGSVSLIAYSEASPSSYQRLTGKGLPGGSVTNVTLHALGGNLEISASSGTSGVGGGAGGAGGVVKNIAVGLFGSAGVRIYAGSGGDGDVLIGQRKVRSPEQDPETPGTEFDFVDVIVKAGAGGNGGSVSKITLSPLEDVAGYASIYSGFGGSGAGAKSGGKAGAIQDIGPGKEAVGWMNSLILQGGQSGAGGKGVKGGSISNVSGLYGTLAAKSGGALSGGSGGDIFGFKNLAVYTLNLETAPGADSQGLPTVQKGGNGGDIKNITAIVTGSVDIEAGYGADGSFIDGEIETRTRLVRSAEQDPDSPGVEYDEVEYDVVTRRPKAGAAGAGGKISGVTITALGASLDEFFFIAGDGGGNDATSEVIFDKDGNSLALGIGGAGGTINALKVLVKEGIVAGDGSLVRLFAWGGNGGGGSRTGGAGGSVQLVVKVPQLLYDLNLTGGKGGAGSLKTGAGGSLLGSVTVGAWDEPVIAPGVGAPDGKNKLVLSPPLVT